ncbi:hypothetical protein [Labedaea rhizosphaerae]|uniref:Uncharacterized protein n=1 Tax=Labedaea rhizosphaerae TaxID=598644 RepID=A0A4R6RS50_LABRH|nr:hypothetical protein [Labedaea rhizosphaerae]TDP89075.1 hypothetical protein EV186_11522 [Labedaea rhizosphaerae]
MHVNWSGLAIVFGVSMGAVLAMVALFSLGIGGMSMRMTAREREASTRPGTVTATIGFAACAAVVAFGVWVIIRG